MSAYLSAFDGVNIPIAQADQDIGTDATLEAFVKLASGQVWNQYGTSRTPASLKTITCKGLVTGSDMHVIQDIIDPIRAKRGVTGTLTKTMGDATTRTRAALLLEAREPRKVTKRHQELTLVFQPLTPGWKGTAHADATTLNTSPKNIVSANGGNRRVVDPIVTIAVPGGGTPITYVEISTTTYCHITWTGTIAAGTSLVIDCGAMTILNNGVNAYSGFARGGSHTQDDWLSLDPGNNTWTITITGGGTTSTFTPAFNDGWE